MSLRRVFILWTLLLCLPGLASAYKYWERAELAKDLKNQIGQEVKVVDEILTTYTKNQTIPGYFKFDTVHFRCLIPNDKTEAIDHVKEVASRKTKGSRRERRLVTIEGKVERKDVYGKVGGKEAGVTSEAILLIVDKASKPRSRYYKDIP